MHVNNLLLSGISVNSVGLNYCDRRAWWTKITRFRRVEEIKRISSSGPILKLPDLERNFIVQTDASNVSIGGCFLQEHDGIKHPVIYASIGSYYPKSRIIQLGTGEAVAIVWVVEKFHRFLYGQHFIPESDHRPLEYIQPSQSKNPRNMRWSLALQPSIYSQIYQRKRQCCRGLFESHIRLCMNM